MNFSNQAPPARLAALRRTLTALYEGDASWARRARDGLLKLDAVILVFVVVTSFTTPAHFTGLGPVWVFVWGALGVAVLAGWVRRSTEQLAEHVGPAIGGLLTISFGSLAEVILALFVLAEARPRWCGRRSPARSSARACWGWAWRSWWAGLGGTGRPSSASAPVSCRAC